MRFLVFVCFVACLAAVHGTDVLDSVSDFANKAKDTIVDGANQAGAAIEGGFNTVKEFAVDRYNVVSDCMEAAGDDTAKKAQCTTKFASGSSKVSGSCGIFMMVFTVLLAVFFQ